MTKKLLIILTAIFCCLCGFNLQAQTGSIKGFVYDTDGTSELIGVNVYVKTGGSLGASTGIDGSYTVNNIPVGTQIVSFSYTGYEAQDKEILIEEGKTTEINVTLSVTAFTGEEIIVTAQAIGQAQAIKQQLNSESIANIVSYLS